MSKYSLTGPSKLLIAVVVLSVVGGSAYHIWNNRQNMAVTPQATGTQQATGAPEMVPPQMAGTPEMAPVPTQPAVPQIRFVDEPVQTPTPSTPAVDPGLNKLLNAKK